MNPLIYSGIVVGSFVAFRWSRNRKALPIREPDPGVQPDHSNLEIVRLRDLLASKEAGLKCSNCQALCPGSNFCPRCGEPTSRRGC